MDSESRASLLVIPAKAGIQHLRRLWTPAFAGMTKRNMSAFALLLLLAASGLAACGRKDVPDFPKDAIDRPGAFDRTQRNQNPRYY
jgi:predicted small lipoprotein YifL